MDIAKIYHKLTKVKYKKGSENPVNPLLLPQEWKTIYFKEYPRMPRIQLLKPEKLDFSLDESLLKRKSGREFNPESISFKEISQLLFYGMGIIEKKENDWNQSRRVYPSGGGRFPLEIYLFNLKAGNELKEGIYHYNVKEHSLEDLLGLRELRKEIYPKLIWQDMIKKVPMILVISAVFNRTVMKYKDRGYRYVLLEGGHLGQNLYLVSRALGLKCCAVGGFDDDGFHEILDIDGKEEAVFYIFAVGH
jgi:SagB-type dehydrogenase family enzyme